jgi:hypothetical protein
MSQNTNSAAFDETFLRELEEELQRIAEKSDDEILADLIASSKRRDPESDKLYLQMGSCKDQTFEQITGLEESAEHTASIDQQQADFLNEHAAAGFVREKELKCVLLGTYLGPYGPSERRCESGGTHECRNLATNSFGDGKIVMKEPFFSVAHI